MVVLKVTGGRSNEKLIKGIPSTNLISFWPLMKIIEIKCMKRLVYIYGNSHAICVTVIIMVVNLVIGRRTGGPAFSVGLTSADLKTCWCHAHAPFPQLECLPATTFYPMPHPVQTDPVQQAQGQNLAMASWHMSPCYPSQLRAVGTFRLPS